MLDLLFELPFLWACVALMVPVLTVLTLETIQTHRLRVQVRRAVLDTDEANRVNSPLIRPLSIRVRPKIPYFRDKVSQDDDDPLLVV
ncbi:hypothetical protein [Shouchella shacheensis]|uniref:hypothetical protein n=1 Tax=Shouchella shacheensis TaxID=1649580 RepID=UPI00073FD5A7|nr:hypothetical protein [Shouchella shacheensis]